MKDYYVEVPIAGKIGLCVEADSEAHAKELALAHTGHYLLKLEDPLPDNIMEGDCEWESFEKLVSGNMVHFSHNEITVEEE